MTDKDRTPLTDEQRERMKEPLLDDAVPVDMDAKLSSGMTIKEAVDRAMLWWSTKGTNEMRLARLQDKGIRRKLAAFSDDPDSPNFIPSGILHGRPWDQLTKTEKLQIVKMWHYAFVVLPDMDPEHGARLLAAQDPGKCFYCGSPAVADETLPGDDQRGMCTYPLHDRYPQQSGLPLAANTNKPGVVE